VRVRLSGRTVRLPRAISFSFAAGSARGFEDGRSIAAGRAGPWSFPRVPRLPEAFSTNTSQVREGVGLCHCRRTGRRSPARPTHERSGVPRAPRGAGLTRTSRVRQWHDSPANDEGGSYLARKSILKGRIDEPGSYAARINGGRPWHVRTAFVSDQPAGTGMRMGPPAIATRTSGTVGRPDRADTLDG
jgi:hypothetical protein